MAINTRTPEQNPQAGKILKTPAPTLDRQHGGLSYGQANDYLTPASVPPGRRLLTELGQNLEQSVDDPVLQRVISGGVSGRDDRIPTDMPDDFQRRAVKDDAYPSAHGMAKRGADSGSPGGAVPPKTGWNPGVPVRTPNLK